MYNFSSDHLVHNSILRLYYIAISFCFSDMNLFNESYCVGANNQPITF